MANEAEYLQNPDSVPGAVSSGYQRQNTNQVAQRAGIDRSIVESGTGNCVLKISGPIDVNGVLYNIKSNATLSIASAGRYYIYLDGSGQYLTPTLTTNAGTFDPSKNARYTAGGYRLLNWVIHYDGTDSIVHRLLTPEEERTILNDLDAPEENVLTSNGDWVAPRSKYYTFILIGKGGDGEDGSAPDNPGRGGGAGSVGKKRIFVEAGDTWTATFNTGSGDDPGTEFTDGSTTLNVQNGDDGSSGGAGGSNNSGMDQFYGGGSGGYGGLNQSNFFFGGNGGTNSYGTGGDQGGAGGNGGDGKGFGGGGGGGGEFSGSTGSGGSGAGGAIIIIG